MLFEVTDNKGITKFKCSSLSCIQTAEALKSMASEGYKFKIDGKTASLKTMLKILEEKSK